MTKKALLVGINSYSNPSSNLRGCINDITMMNGMLVQNFGFDPANIRMLVDARATKANIIERLSWLVKDAQPGDSLVFDYSGHGSLIVLRDAQGDILDAQQPILCTFELNWDNPLSFKEIGQILVAQEGVNITSILDCCHSGHDFRALSNPNFPDKTAGDQNDVIYRYLRPPVDIHHRISGLKARDIAPMRLSDDTDILMTGCTVAQQSADAYIKGAYRGAFTYCLNEALAAANYEIDYVNLLGKVAQALRQNGFTQTPQLEGAMKLSRWPVFGNPMSNLVKETI